MYSTIVFDLDGTLLNTLDDLAVAGNHTLTTLGCPIHQPQDYRLMVGNGIQALISRMMPQSRQDTSSLKQAQEIFTEYYKAHSIERTAPYPGIVTLLNDLKNKGYCLAVLSNKNQDNVQYLVSHYFGRLFDEVMGLREPFAPKPDPASLHALLQKLNAPAASTLFCGDSRVDVLTAKHAKLHSCAVLWGFRDREELEKESPTYMVSSANEILQIVSKDV